MKTEMRILIFTAITFLSVALSVQAQKGIQDGSKYGHGQDSIDCIRNFSIYKEYYKQGNYKDAMQPWRALYRDCPKSYESMYVDGIKMYNSFIQKETNPANQALLLDTLEMIYMQRIKYFNKRGEMLGRFAGDFLQVRRTEVADAEKAYKLLEESISLEKNKSMPFVISSYFTSSIVLFNNQKLTADKVIENYNNVSDIIEARLTAKPGDPDWLKVKESVDQNFAAFPGATCENLIAIFGPKFEKEPENLEVIKKISKMLDDRKCTDAPLYEKVVEKQYQLEPSAKSAYYIANLFLKKEKYDKSVEYFKQAIEKETDPKDKANYYYLLGSIVLSQYDQPEQARRYALEAIKLRGDWGAPYILIGKCYISSRNTCTTEEFKRNAIFWVAVDKFVQAKSADPSSTDEANGLIREYSKYFPNKENAFFYGIKPGDPYKIDYCWIGETTTARF
jgi:tetratricopeptide (TPR) repeat protein